MVDEGGDELGEWFGHGDGVVAESESDLAGVVGDVGEAERAKPGDGLGEEQDEAAGDPAGEFEVFVGEELGVRLGLAGLEVRPLGCGTCGSGS